METGSESRLRSTLGVFGGAAAASLIVIVQLVPSIFISPYLGGPKGSVILDGVAGTRTS